MKESTDHLHKWLNDELQTGDSVEGAEKEDRDEAQKARDDKAPPRQRRIRLVDEDQRAYERHYEDNEVPRIRSIGVLSTGQPNNKRLSQSETYLQHLTVVGVHIRVIGDFAFTIVKPELPFDVTDGVLQGRRLGPSPCILDIRVVPKEDVAIRTLVM